MKVKNKNPWPTKKAMKQVYDLGLWGNGIEPFYSGEGSHLQTIVHPYVNAVIDFLKFLNKEIHICDLGCGDFNVARHFEPYCKSYTGVDIVENLIAYNSKKFATETIKFVCRDIAEDKLPDGDCAIIRQVLQHLSNVEIKKILQKLNQYQYVILTEHIPQGDFKPNMDIISGQGIRLKKNSGVDITGNPFNFQYKSHVVLNTVLPKNGKGYIVTTLFTL